MLLAALGHKVRPATGQVQSTDRTIVILGTDSQQGENCVSSLWFAACSRRNSDWHNSCNPNLLVQTSAVWVTVQPGAFSETDENMSAVAHPVRNKMFGFFKNILKRQAEVAPEQEQLLADDDNQIIETIDDIEPPA